MDTQPTPPDDVTESPEITGENTNDTPTAATIRIRTASPTVNTIEPSQPRLGSVSESSDEGYHLSPAAARRFARRNMRRTSPTPDLVTSLVRPPSPEAFYMSPQVQNRVRSDIRARIQRAHSATQSVGPGVPVPGRPSHRRNGASLKPHSSSLDIPTEFGGDSIFDLYCLTYLREVDPSLLCPICHDPLVDPVSTPCDHVFCYRCIRRSLSSSPLGQACPIDREPLQWSDCTQAMRLVRSQLNGLLVKCPNHIRGCTNQSRREAVESHVSTECRFTEYACPGKNCDKKLRYKPTSDSCLHEEAACRLCDQNILLADQDVHLSTSCPKSSTRCTSCWELVKRSDMTNHHDFDCDGVEVGCLYADLGCLALLTRGQLGLHVISCAFNPDTPSGAIIRAQRNVIAGQADLQSRVQDVEARQEASDRRLAELSSSVSRQTGSSASGSALDDTRTIQDLDAGFEEIHQNLTHLEARQSMWTMNQVMPIREEVTELRNNINMVRMHVNWLLNRSREEGRIRAANNTGSANSSTAAIRRTSDSETIPVLPERRRSSGNEMDLPRL